MKSFYDILEVTPAATTAEIRASYLKLAREYHPDRVPEYLTKLRADAEEKVKQINEAWGVLSDPAKRRKYDSKLHGNPTTPTSSSSTAGSAVSRPPRTLAAILEWLHTRKEALRWGLVIGISALILLIIGELIALRGIKPQLAGSEVGVVGDDQGPQRILRFDLKPVRFQASAFAGTETFNVQLLSVQLSDTKTVVAFRVAGGNRSGFILYEPPGGSTRTRIVMGKSVVVDRGFEEPYLVDSSGTKYHSTSGLIGGEQANFDLYNFTRRINLNHTAVTLSCEFPPLDHDVPSVTFVLPALGEWQAEWRWPDISLK